MTSAGDILNAWLNLQSGVSRLPGQLLEHLVQTGHEQVFHDLQSIPETSSAIPTPENHGPGAVICWIVSSTGV